MAVTPLASPPRIALLICYLGFVSLGLPDTLIGVAWPSIRETFSLQQSAVSWIFIGAGCSYFVSSFFAGRMLKVFNVGVLLAASSALVGLGGLNFSFAGIWGLFVFGSLLHGLGSGAIDAGLNHYVANHFSARHMNWLHACYSAGAMLGPLVMTAMITRAGSWRLGYLVVGVMLLTLAFLFMLTRAQWNDPGGVPLSEVIQEPTPKNVTARMALRHGTVWLHIMLFFVYTGLEVALGQWSFTVLTESRDIGRELAGVWVTTYWASILAGRIVFGFVVDRVGIDTLVRLSTIATVAGTALFAWNPVPWLIPMALALAGLGLAAIYPSLMTRTPQRLGKEIASHAIGFQVGAAMLGAAVLPSLTGLVGQYLGLHYVAATLLVMASGVYLLHELVVVSTARAR